MKKLLITLTILTGIIVIFQSCKKEEDNYQTNFEKIQLKLVENEKQPKIINEDELKYIGLNHNKNLNKIFKNFNWEANDLKLELKNKLKIENIKLKDNSEKYLSLRCKNDYYENYRKLKNNLSPKSFNIIKEGIMLSDNINNISSFNEQIEALKIRARNNIQDINELNVILVTLEVLKSSAYFWSPKSIGGSGIGEGYINSYKRHYRNATIEDILKADGISAGIGMLGIAAAGMMGPIGWGALAIVAGESALSSASALIF